jgi:hypothetical protein
MPRAAFDVASALGDDAEETPGCHWRILWRGQRGRTGWSCGFCSTDAAVGATNAQFRVFSGTLVTNAATA